MGIHDERPGADGPPGTKLSVQSWSELLFHPSPVKPRPPVVTRGSVGLEPDSSPSSQIGVQVAVLDGADPGAAHSVRFDQYYCLPQQKDWTQSYAVMWDQIATDLGYLDRPGDVLLVVTYGLDANMPPTDRAVTLFKTAGSGSTLTRWLNTCFPGGHSDDPNVWTSAPCVYVLVGAFGNKQGEAVEVVQRGGQIAEVDLNVDLSRKTQDGRSAIGGRLPSPAGLESHPESH